MYMTVQEPRLGIIFMQPVNLVLEGYLWETIPDTSVSEGSERLRK